MTTRRFPFAPLEPLIEARWAPSPNVQTISIVGKAHSVLGFDRNLIYRWIKDGLSIDAADRVAVQLGLHPSVIWPDWFQSATPDRRNLVLRKPDRRSLLPQPPYKPCGTNAAAKRHRRAGEPLCDPCRLAERLYALSFARQREEASA